MNKKIIANYFYATIYQLLIVVLPLITMPYKAKTLGPDNIGIYSFIFSVFQYLIMLGTIGINFYGKREIAYVRNDIFKRSKLLYELIILKLVTFTIVITLFYLFIGIKSEYSILYIIILPDILFNIFDLTWFYQGLEQFKEITIVNSIIRIMNVACIFLFVNTSNDLMVYFIITVIFDILPIVIFLICLRKYVKKIGLKHIKVFRHLKICIFLFLPQIFINIYHVFDKIMLGILSENIKEVGFYEYSYKIIQISLNLISTFSLVIIPVLSREFANKNNEKIKEYINSAINFVIFIAIPLTFGIIAISNNLVSTIFGTSYLKMNTLIKILALSIIPISITSIIGEGYLVSTKKEKQFTIYIIIGAITNVLLNLILIHNYFSTGAALATAITEMIILIIELPIIKKLVNINETIINLIKYFMFSMIMLIVVWIIGAINSGYISIILQVVVGGMLYFALLFIVKDKNLSYMIKNIIK